MNRTLAFVFTINILTRFLFSWIHGFTDNYSLQPDSHWLVAMADQAVQGNFNFDISRFIASPLFPVICAGFKMLFGSSWNMALVLFQVLLSGISGISIYKITLNLFDDRKPALLAAITYALFPMTLYYVNTFSQETLFQCLFIFFFHFLIRSIKQKSVPDLMVSSVFFSLAYLTKSHALIYSCFIPVIFLVAIQDKKKAILYTLRFAFFPVLFSLPYGLYHLKKNDTYVLSSNGAGVLFYYGNTEAGYISMVDVPPKNSKEFVMISDITRQAGFFNGNEARYDSILALPQGIKQKIFFQDGFRWIKEHPIKFIRLKLNDLIFFIMPGVSWRHYSFLNWLSGFVFSLPVYVFAYIGMYKSLRRNFKMHFPALCVWLCMLLFSIVWYTQNRFRTITLEPVMIVYFSFSICSLFEKLSKSDQVFTKFLRLFDKEIPA